MFQKIIDHFKYPSTWQSLVGAAATVGVVLSPELQNAIVVGGVAVVTIIGFFFSDADVKPKS